MNRRRLALAAGLFSLAAAAQSPPVDLNVAQAVSGSWSGRWQSLRDTRSGGAMDIDLQVDGDQVSGRAKAGIRGDCSNQWQKLSGVLKDGKVLGSYQLGGRCGKVDLVLWLEPDNSAMTGTWTSEFPSHGTYTLRKVSSSAR